jgi:hypothetical protein
MEQAVATASWGVTRDSAAEKRLAEHTITWVTGTRVSFESHPVSRHRYHHDRCLKERVKPNGHNLPLLLPIVNLILP